MDQAYETSSKKGENQILQKDIKQEVIDDSVTKQEFQIKEEIQDNSILEGTEEACISSTTTQLQALINANSEADRKLFKDSKIKSETDLHLCDPTEASQSIKGEGISHTIIGQSPSCAVQKYEIDTDTICYICDCFFLSPQGLKVHEVICQHDCASKPTSRIPDGDVKGIFICDACTFCCFLKSDVASHVAFHSLHQGLVCCVCKEVFGNMFLLIQHVSKHPEARPSPHVSNFFENWCSVCQQSFASKYIFNHHKKIHYSCLSYNKIHNTSIPEETEGACVSSTRVQLQASKNTDNKANIKLIKYTKTDLDVDKPAEASQTIQEEVICHKIIGQSSSYAMEEDGTDTICYICDYFFLTPDGLKAHEGISQHECNSKPASSIPDSNVRGIFICDACTFCCYLKSDVTDHVAFHSLHQGLVCCVCKEVFDNMLLLVEHVSKHTEARPSSHVSNFFENWCSVCQRSFAGKYTFNRHKKIHNSCLSYTCKHCNFTTKHFSSLQRHYLIHEGGKVHTCPHCDYTSLRQNNVKQHMAVHNEIRQHACDICGKTFKRYYHLNNHKAVHQVKRNYQCSKCTASFKRCHHLKRHMLIHAKNAEQKVPV